MPQRGLTYQAQGNALGNQGTQVIKALKGRNIKDDLHMPQSLSKVLLHIVFSTKNRQPWLTDGVRSKMHAYLAGACRNQGSEAHRVGGTQDHIHIACTLPRTLTISKLLEEIKRSSSAWVKEQDSNCKEFSWQAGYGAFSLGQSQLGTLLNYIDNQLEHHRHSSFQEEFLDFLQKYGIDYDERYLWE